MIQDPELWNALPVPALLIAADDTIAEINPAAEAFLNLSSRALEGRPLWDKIMVDAPIEEPFARARRDATPLFVNDVDVGSGERPPSTCNLQFAPLPHGKGMFLLMISPREIASRMNQHHLTGKAAKSAIGMAEMLAHEIKNPLAGITGAAQLLAMNLDHRDLELTDLIVDECRRIVGLLEQVEQFGNLTPPRAQLVNIHDILDRARTSAAVGVAAHMTFSDAYDPSLPLTRADPDQLTQIVLNLLKNAAEAAEGTGHIHLRTFYDASLRVTQEDGSTARLPLQVEVTDDGPGLPPDIAADVFDPFVSGRENGTGLGLALVAKLARQNGGWIGVDSRPGRTTFRLSLPRAPQTGET